LVLIFSKYLNILYFAPGLSLWNYKASVMNHHEKAAQIIVSRILDRILKSDKRYTITLAGESGSGKTETGKALVSTLNSHGIRALVLGQDNYFVLPPTANDRQRKADPGWLGPHVEVNLTLMEDHLRQAKKGTDILEIPHIDYDTNITTIQRINIENVQVIIAEGTYTSLLRSVDTRIFIDEDYKATLKFRKQRNRGNEVNDPFVENILETEHKIIAGHKFLADFVILESLEVVIRD
jgi:uridine kinase